jgi:hypothetical protein
MKLIQNIFIAVLLFSTTPINAQELIDDILTEVGRKVVVDEDKLLLYWGDPGDGAPVEFFQKEGNSWLSRDLIDDTTGTNPIYVYDVDFDGDWAIMVDLENDNQDKRVFFYHFENDNWIYQNSFTYQSDYSLASVSMDGDWATFGSFENDTVYVYHLENEEWVEHQSLAFEDSTNITSDPRFGETVKINGDYLVAAAPNYAFNTSYGDYGAYYIYKRETDNTWTKLHTIYTQQVTGGTLGMGPAMDINDNTFVFSVTTTGEQNVVFAMEFDQDTIYYKDQFAPVGDVYFGAALKLYGNDLFITDRYLQGSYYHYRYDGSNWNFITSYSAPNNINLGYGVDFDGSNLFVSANARLQIFGVRSPGITFVSQGHSSSYSRINWENNSALSNIQFTVFRDGEAIATTSGAARSYFDYEGVSGKMHTYSVVTYNPLTSWLSYPAIAHGYKQPTGIVEGTVQTPIGSGVREVQMQLEPDGIVMQRALYIDSVQNAMSVIPFLNAPDSAITVSFWIKSNEDNTGTLFDFVSENRANAFTINNAQNITISVNDNDIATQIDVADNSWHHLAATWRNTDGQLTLYDNGIQVFQTKFMAGESFFVPDAFIYFGANGSISSGTPLENPFSGWLDELRIWNHVRSDSAISADMYRRFIGNESGLISYYNFDDPQRFNVDFIPDLVWSRANHATAGVLLYETNPNNVIHQKREINTDAAGRFSYKNVYYDAARDFILTPFKTDHGFLPESVSFDLASGSPAQRNIVIIDTTSFTVSGSVFYASTDCPLPGAELILNGQPTGVFTKIDGTYQLTIEDPGSVQLEVFFADSSKAHIFIPSALNLQVNDNIFDADFSNVTTSRLYGRVGAACNNPLGVATIDIVSANQCFTRTIETDANGNFSINLPSQEYLITAQVDGLPNLFDVVSTDLTFHDSLINFIDREPPLIRISGLPETCFDVPVVAQYEQYFITIEVLDMFGEDFCPVDTGFITIYDAVSDMENEPVQLKLSNGQAHYILKPGIPNILSGGDHPFQKLFQVTADVDGSVSSHEQWMLVTGHRPRSETFVTKTPELPLMILRDPPGDQSYSYIEKGTSITSSYTVSRELGGAAGIYTEMKIGAGIPIPFTGVVIGARTHIEGKILAGVKDNRGTNLVTNITHTERFSTSDDDNITGRKGDVFVGASFNMIYALTDIIDFDESSCNVLQDTQLVWGSEEINTDYIYTENHIRNTLLPQLRLLRSLASPDSVVLLGTYIDVWEQVLRENERLKRAARKEKNISFSAGTSREYSSTVTSDSTIHIDFTVFIDSEIKIGVGFGDTKFSDIEVGVAANFRWSKTTVRDTTFQKSTTVGYVLGDDDSGDFFSVDIKTDPTYDTPVFELVSGTSSCPWEPGSQPRDGTQLTMDSYVRNDVPVDQKAAFALYIGNTSQSGETRDYDLSVIQSSNLDGAIISVGGVVIEDALHYTVPAGEQIKATLAVERGPLAWDYENLKIRLYSPCDPSLADTINFSVHYDSPCSDVNIFRPDNNWLVNASNNDTLSVVMNDYNRSDPDLEMIIFEYRPVGGSWKAAFSIVKNELPAEYVRKNWDVSNLPNGKYELRAVARCNSGLSYSPVLQGTIDRSALIVFGKPQPADGILNIGEDIKITFSEDLDCENLSNNAIQLQDEEGNLIAAESICSGKDIIVTTVADIATYEGQLLQATVVSVKDVSGNSLREPYSWIFRVNQNPVYWSVSNTSQTFYKGSEPQITATIRNAGAQSETISLVSIPSWLTANAVSGNVPVSGTIDFTFEVSNTLNPGRYVDTLYAQTTRGDEPFIADITVLAQPPLWIVNSNEFAYSMNVTAQLNILGNPSQDIFDKVAAFVGNEVRGAANVQFVSNMHGYLAFITIYSNSPAGEQISFSGWDASEGNEYANVSQSFTFIDGSQLGSLSDPIILNPQGVAQSIDLNSGWTWISLNVQRNPMNINDVMAAVEAQTGDIIKSQRQFAQYVQGGGWQGSLQRMQTGENYLVKLSNPSGLRFIGSLINKNDKLIQLQQGWTWIGYIGNRITDINTALALFNAGHGDRIKSQTEFAQYDAQSNAWFGSLEYLNPGEGYKILTNTSANFNFSKSGVITEVLAATGAPENWQVLPQLYEHNMSMVARLDFGTKSKLDSMDVIAAFVGNECRAVVNPVFIPALNRYQVFLTIYGTDSTEKVHFRMLESETGIVYSSGNEVTFTADTTLGSIEKPMQLGAAYATNEGALPISFKLYQNYPNPFNPFTTIRYEVPTRTDVKLTLYNVLGQQVRTLVNETLNAGRYRVEINAGSLASGLYFYKFEAGNYTKIRKMLLVK